MTHHSWLALVGMLLVAASAEEAPGDARDARPVDDVAMAAHLRERGVAAWTLPTSVTTHALVIVDERQQEGVAVLFEPAEPDIGLDLSVREVLLEIVLRIREPPRPEGSYGIVATPRIHGYIGLLAEVDCRAQAARVDEALESTGERTPVEAEPFASAIACIRDLHAFVAKPDSAMTDKERIDGIRRQIARWKEVRPLLTAWHEERGVPYVGSWSARMCEPLDVLTEKMGEPVETP